MSLIDDDAQVCTCGHRRVGHGSYALQGAWSGSVGGGACGWCDCEQMEEA